MHWVVIVDLVRELRFWVPSSASCSCPWGWLLVVIFLTFLFGCCCGSCLASCFLLHLPGLPLWSEIGFILATQALGGTRALGPGLVAEAEV